MESIMDILAAMSCQEENYLAPSNSLYESPDCGSEFTCATNEMDMDSRGKMAIWCYQAADLCNFQRETVAIAMNIFDRFLTCDVGRMICRSNIRTYQLAAMTSYYTAVKVHEPEPVNPSFLVKMSAGTYSEQEIEAMELNILQGVSWRVNPPTALSFVRSCLNLIDEEILDVVTRQAFYELVQVQTECASLDRRFSAIRPSIIAYCSMMNAMTNVSEATMPLVWGILTMPLAEVLRSTDCQTKTDVQLYLMEAMLQDSQEQDFDETWNSKEANHSTSPTYETKLDFHKPSSSPRSVLAQIEQR